MRLAFGNQHDRLCRFHAIGLLVKPFNKDRYLHGFLPVRMAGIARLPIRLPPLLQPPVAIRIYHMAPQRRLW